MTYARVLNEPIPFDHPRDKWKWACNTPFADDWSFGEATLHMQRIGGEPNDPEFTWRMHDLTEMFKTKPLIGLAGKKYSGKGTIARRLVDVHRFKEFAFADRIKAGLQLLVYEWLDDGDEFDRDGQLDKEAPIPGLGKSRRELWQSLGDWMIQELGEDILVRAVEQEIATHPTVGTCPGVVISDVRLEAEAAWIRKMGGSVLHIIGTQPCGDGHRTEQGLTCTDQDHILTNSGSKEQFIADAVRKLNDMVHG